METISAKELDRYAADGRSMIIDLRSRKEFAAAHVPGALNVPQGRFRGELAGKGRLVWQWRATWKKKAIRRKV